MSLPLRGSQVSFWRSIHHQMRIGSFELKDRVFAAPMAGVTDTAISPAGRGWVQPYAVSEMVASDPRVRGQRQDVASARSRRASRRRSWCKLVGADPAVLADRRPLQRRPRRADHRLEHGLPGAQGLPGRPAVRPCSGTRRSWADRAIGGRGGRRAVTLKYRTGWDPADRNAVRIARMAESAGVQMLTLHGRTRACGFKGQAEYETRLHAATSTFAVGHDRMRRFSAAIVSYSA